MQIIPTPGHWGFLVIPSHDCRRIQKQYNLCIYLIYPLNSKAVPKTQCLKDKAFDSQETGFRDMNN